MDNRFFEDQEVHAIFWPDDSYFVVGENGTDKITL